MRKSFMLLLPFMLSICTAISIQAEGEPGFEGIWKGSGSQDSTTFWTIKIKISENRFLIDYPTAECGGKLILTTKKNNRIEFRESLTYGKSKCINNGKVVLIKDESNHAQFQWYYNNGRKGAKGTLTRQ